MKTEDFIGEKVMYDDAGQKIFAVDKEGGHQMLLDLRGWGAIQHLFKDSKEAAKFQDGVGLWIVDAINTKLAISKLPVDSEKLMTLIAEQLEEAKKYRTENDKEMDTHRPLSYYQAKWLIDNGFINTATIHMPKSEFTEQHQTQAEGRTIVRIAQHEWILEAETRLKECVEQIEHLHTYVKTGGTGSGQGMLLRIKDTLAKIPKQ